MAKRKTRLNHRTPDALEQKIIDTFGSVTAPSVAKMLGVKSAKVYSTLRKFQIPIRDDSNVEGTKYGKKKDKVKPRSNAHLRITNPYKTNQLK